MHKKIMLAVDPGVHTGYAVFENETIVKTGTITENHYDNFSHTLIENFIEIVVMESAVVQGMRTQASGKNFTRLCEIIGLYKMACDKLSIPYVMYSVTQWKGQLKNKVVRRWIIEKTGIDYHPVHVLCAVGIGLYHRGEF